MARRNVFVVGLDAFNREQLGHVDHPEQLHVHELLDFETVKGAEGEAYPFNKVLDQARERLRAFDGRIDAITGYWDFPVTTLVPILAREFGTTGPSLESVVRCEHKAWSRQCQQAVIPDACPQFAAFNPFDDDPWAAVAHLPLPIWVKPIKGTASVLGYKIKTEDDFRQAIPEIRDGITDIARGFNQLLEHVDLPENVREMDGHWCLAETLLSGDQCTVSGYVYNQEVVCYGVVDSVNYTGTSSFECYEYPSTLPERVQKRLCDLSQKVISHIGLDCSTFNIEYFYDTARDSIGLLEINPRISQSHANIYEKVDGLPNHELLIDLALDREPRWRQGEGRFRKSAKFFIRSFEKDAKVRQLPSEQDLAAVREAFPDVLIELVPEAGQKLSDMAEQEPYSYELAHIFVGADDHDGLYEKFDRIRQRLSFDLEPVG